MKTKLNVFLGKEGNHRESLIRKFEDGILNAVEVTNGTFFYKEVKGSVPVWVENLFGTELQGKNLENKTIQAVYLLEVEVKKDYNRFFAITFGLGRNLLNLEKFEEDFGLITTLNLVNENDLRSLDTNTLGNGAMKHFIQIGHSSNLNDFGIDLEKDLVKNLSGKLSSERGVGDAKSISGKQSVLLSSTVNLLQIPDILKELYSYYQSKEYEKRFPGMNNAKLITTNDRIEYLDNRALRLFNGDLDEENNIELSFPEFKRDHEVGSFRFGSSNNLHEELDLKELKADLNSMLKGRLPTIQTLKNIPIQFISDEGGQLGRSSIYKCLSIDLTERDKQYVLNEGKWYSFNLSYVDEVNEFYNCIEIYKGDLSEYRSKEAIEESENKYNERMCLNSDNFEKLDCRCINPFDQSPFEVCDIFDKAKNAFIHVKHNNGSNQISHLIMQGYVSGEQMINKTVREKLLQQQPEMESNIKVFPYDPSSYKIVYAIIDRSKGSKKEIKQIDPICLSSLKLASVKP